MNRWFLDPIFFGDYPDEMKERFAPELPVLSHDEQEIARQPIDFLGINYYSRVIVGDDPEDPLLGVKGVAPEDGRCTAIGWEIYPRGLCEVLMMVRSRYGDVPLYITENGAAFEDLADEAGVVNDVERIEFLESHLAQAHRAIEEEVDLRGYFVYTLMDNWECAYGFTAKFGLIRMDPVTLKRTIKASGHWYGRLSRSSSRAPSRFL
jgi:beta-glucosidase